MSVVQCVTITNQSLADTTVWSAVGYFLKQENKQEQYARLFLRDQQCPYHRKLSYSYHYAGMRLLCSSGWSIAAFIEMTSSRQPLAHSMVQPKGDPAPLSASPRPTVSLSTPAQVGSHHPSSELRTRCCAKDIGIRIASAIEPNPRPPTEFFQEAFQGETRAFPQSRCPSSGNPSAQARPLAADHDCFIQHILPLDQIQTPLAF